MGTLLHSFSWTSVTFEVQELLEAKQGKNNSSKNHEQTFIFRLQPTNGETVTLYIVLVQSSSGSSSSTLGWGVPNEEVAMSSLSSWLTWTVDARGGPWRLLHSTCCNGYSNSFFNSCFAWHFLPPRAWSAKLFFQLTVQPTGQELVQEVAQAVQQYWQLLEELQPVLQLPASWVAKWLWCVPPAIYWKWIFAIPPCINPSILPTGSATAWPPGAIICPCPIHHQPESLWALPNDGLLAKSHQAWRLCQDLP